MKKRIADEPNSSRSLLLLFGTACLVLLSDQLTKFIALHSLKSNISVPIFPNVFHFTLVENSGIAFGLFERHPEWLTLIITASIIALTIYGWFFRRQPDFQKLAYGFILGGAYGNWTDRLRFQHVIDFLDFRVWPVFNIADSFITIGVLLFIWFAIRGE